jgi:hypothetical protein
MEFCSIDSCPASSLESRVNNVISPVNKEIEPIPLPPSDPLLMQDRHREEALLLKQAELLLIDVIKSIDNFIEIKSKQKENFEKSQNYQNRKGNIKAMGDDLGKAKHLHRSVTVSLNKIQTKLSSFTQTSTTISDIVKAYEGIIRLDLPEKERYKKDVADPIKDFSTVLIEGKNAARERKIEKLKSSAASQNWSREVLSEMIGELSDDGGNCDFLIRKGEIRRYLYEARDLARSGQWSQAKSKLNTISLTVKEKVTFSEVASAKTVYEKAKSIEEKLKSAILKNIGSLKKEIDRLDIDGDAKKD